MQSIKEKKRLSASYITQKDLAKQLVQVPQITNEGHLIKRTRPTQNMVIKANGNRDLELCHINGFHNHQSEQSRSARRITGEAHFTASLASEVNDSLI